MCVQVAHFPGGPLALTDFDGCQGSHPEAAIGNSCAGRFWKPDKNEARKAYHGSDWPRRDPLIAFAGAGAECVQVAHFSVMLDFEPPGMKREDECPRLDTLRYVTKGAGECPRLDTFADGASGPRSPGT